MPAVGQDTGRTYYEHEILDPDLFALMRTEPLWLKGTADQVTPVRRADAPNFRRFSLDGCRTRVGAGPEADTAHNRCIEFLLRNLQDRELILSTPTFEDGTRDAEGQVLLNTRKTGKYSWWSDRSGTRIPVGGGRYIQPDLCGRLGAPLAFHATNKAPNIIIEVIKHHYPDEPTMLELLRLSERNHIVVLLFMGETSYGSRYCRLLTETNDPFVRLRPVMVLTGGTVVMNGNVEPPSPPPLLSEGFDVWFAALEQRQLLPVMADR